MRARSSFVVLATAIAVATIAAPASAVESRSVSITANTTFTGNPDPFVADLPGCGNGEVSNGPANFAFTPGHGVFAGFKVFECSGSDSGFVLRLNARFSAAGSVGTWSVVDSWGTLARMQGSGKLVGVLVTDGITDVYSGTVVLV